MKKSTKRFFVRQKEWSDYSHMRKVEKILDKKGILISTEGELTTNDTVSKFLFPKNVVVTYLTLDKMSMSYEKVCVEYFDEGKNIVDELLKELDGHLTKRRNCF